MDYAQLSTFVEGFAFALSLIMAIGIQNAFVLRQGILGRHIGIVWIICAGSDSILMTAGVFGLGAWIGTVDGLESILKWIGASWIAGYGILKLRAAWRCDYASELADLESGTKTGVGSAYATALTCLAITWGNPHVYLDTVVLVGTISLSVAKDYRWIFALGAISASWVFFAALGWGARFLRPYFLSEKSWRYLDFGMAAVMFSLALVIIWP